MPTPPETLTFSVYFTLKLVKADGSKFFAKINLLTGVILSLLYCLEYPLIFKQLHKCVPLHSY